MFFFFKQRTAYEMRISDWGSDVFSSDLAGTRGGVERISWIVVAYLVATTVAAPVYGQLGDLLGRRLLLVIALVVFMTASLLCALSTSIEMQIGRAWCRERECQ